jgi:mannose-6-phosphate isomerase-like protein (cupin superfamily)
VGGVLLERATREIEGQVSNDALERQLIGPLSTHGVTLSLVAIPDTWTSRSNDVIHVVRKGSGELTVFSNKIRIKEGDAFAIPFGISYQLKNEGREMLILLSSILHPYHV